MDEKSRSGIDDSETPVENSEKKQTEKSWRRGPVYAMRWPIIGRAPRSGMLI